MYLWPNVCFEGSCDNSYTDTFCMVSPHLFIELTLKLKAFKKSSTLGIVFKSSFHCHGITCPPAVSQSKVTRIFFEVVFVFLDVFKTGLFKFRIPLLS